MSTYTSAEMHGNLKSSWLMLCLAAIVSLTVHTSFSAAPLDGLENIVFSDLADEVDELESEASLHAITGSFFPQYRLPLLLFTLSAFCTSTVLNSKVSQSSPRAPPANDIPH